MEPTVKSTRALAAPWTAAAKLETTWLIVCVLRGTGHPFS
jgi:hypothetical protein